MFFEDIFETVTYVSKIHRSGPKLINVVKEISSKGFILTSGQQIWVWIYIIGWNSNEILLHHDNWNQGSVVPINIISIESFTGCTILMSSIFANNWCGLRTRLHPKMISAMSLIYAGDRSDIFDPLANHFYVVLEKGNQWEKYWHLWNFWDDSDNECSLILFFVWWVIHNIVINMLLLCIDSCILLITRMLPLQCLL